jgi:hypothetical protein
VPPSSFRTRIDNTSFRIHGWCFVAPVVVAFAAGGIRAGAAARTGLIRLREGSGAAMIMLGLGLALAGRPST